MSSLHASVINAFKTAGWAYRAVPEMEVLESEFEAYHTKVPLHVQSFGEMHIVNVVANGSHRSPNAYKSRAAELLMRANKELNIGNFEMDWDTGHVMFRQSQVFSPHRYDEKIITSLVHNAVAEMDRLTPYLGVLYRTTVPMLPMLSLSDLLLREDLLPPPPVSEEE